MSGLRLCCVLALGHCLLAAVVGCSTVQRLTPREESKVRAAQLQELQLKVGFQKNVVDLKQIVDNSYLQ